MIEKIGCMNKHISLLGLLHLIMGAMGVMALAFVSVILLFGFSVISPAGAETSLLYGVVGMIILVIALVSSVPDLLVGYGLIKRRSWARVFTIVLSVINLFAFPFGTMLGAYGLWVMFQPGVAEEFASNPRPFVTPNLSGEQAG